MASRTTYKVTIYLFSLQLDCSWIPHWSPQYLACISKSLPSKISTQVQNWTHLFTSWTKQPPKLETRVVILDSQLSLIFHIQLVSIQLRSLSCINWLLSISTTIADSQPHHLSPWPVFLVHCFVPWFPFQETIPLHCCLTLKANCILNEDNVQRIYLQ